MGTVALFVTIAVVSWLALPTAASVEPVVIEGNENCSSVTGLTEILRLEDGAVADGSHGVAGGSISVDVNDGKSSFSWSSSGLIIGAVFVKGGPDGNLYDYRPAGATGDTGLTAPVNRGGGQAQISHITFCGFVVPPTSSTVTTATSTVTTAPSTVTTAAVTTSPESGRIVVVKELFGSASSEGASPVFHFAASYDPDGFVLELGESDDSGMLAPGVYWVREDPAGFQIDGGRWDLISAACDDGSDPSAVSLAAGETVTCVFTNAFTEVAGIQVTATTVGEVTGGTLPFTGFDAGLLSAYGAALAGLGTAILRAGRRRRRA